jgi:tetratricopeptide (TPR) repeat protein
MSGVTMSERPMHTVPGAWDRLMKIYADGTAAITAGRHEEAVALFTEGIGIDDHFRQQYVTQYAQRAFALHQLGRLAEAIDDYGKAIEMEPEFNQAQYHFHRAICLGATPGQDEAAIADYGRAMALHPDHPGPYHLRGKLLISKLHRYAEGLADIDELLRRREVPEGFQLRAEACLNLQRYDEAADAAARAEAMQPNGYNHYVMAIAAGARGDEAAAEKHVAATLASRPDFKPYLRAATEMARFQAQPWFVTQLGG